MVSQVERVLTDEDITELLAPFMLGVVMAK